LAGKRCISEVAPIDPCFKIGIGIINVV